MPRESVTGGGAVDINVDVDVVNGKFVVVVVDVVVG